jgi:hypothetical protein
MAAATLPLDWDALRTEAWHEERARKRAMRAQVKRARDAGLARRHEAKLWRCRRSSSLPGACRRPKLNGRPGPAPLGWPSPDPPEQRPPLTAGGDSYRSGVCPSFVAFRRSSATKVGLHRAVAARRGGWCLSIRRLLRSGDHRPRRSGYTVLSCPDWAGVSSGVVRRTSAALGPGLRGEAPSTPPHSSGQARTTSMKRGR